MERWEGRVAIVTGASSGIGAAIARVLAGRGMRVVAVARREDRLKSLAAEAQGLRGEIHPMRGDVRSEEDVLRLVRLVRETLGGAHVLVNNAGLGYHEKLSEATETHMRETVEVNVLGLSMFTREVIKDMRDRGVDDGHIFHINSIVGQRLPDLPGGYIYAATKHAVTVLTEGLRRELRDLGTKIRVTSISPGVVRTEIMVASGSCAAEDAEERYNSMPHLEASDIAEALVYALAAPPHVQVHEITISPVGEKF